MDLSVILALALIALLFVHSRVRLARRKPAPKADPPAETPAEPRAPAPRHMFLTAEHSAHVQRYPLMSSRTVQVTWVSETDPDVRRTPEETTAQYAPEGPLRILGQAYPCLDAPDSPFAAMQRGERTTDCFGREIFCYRERFPCFDSADLANERRAFRWYFVREGDMLARVFHADSTDAVLVTDDVRHVDTSCWEAMKEAGFCQPTGETADAAAP